MDNKENENLKCPFRTKDGEFMNCYGCKCMAYYEMPYLGCKTGEDETKGTPICKFISMLSNSNMGNTPISPYPYQPFNPYYNYTTM